MFGNRILFNLFLEVSLISNKSEQLELKLELVKIIWIEKHAGKVKKKYVNPETPFMLAQACAS